MAYLCGYIASELLLVALILDISALLIFLKIDLENIIHSSELQTIDEEDNCDDIKDIIILHQELLRLLKGFFLILVERFCLGTPVNHRTKN